ncbi:MAG TPA: serine/threonine protein kinase, partial [Polyangiaceae bacterium]|nr:serine/threonine protein kinase [Polyangiaceae bacterium]
MGTVFEAEHLAVGCKVALKVLRADHARKEPLVERFRREARAAGRLVHPNVCHVHDLDYLDDSRPYLVMERLVGETLAERLARQVTTRPGDIVDV